MLYTQTHVRDNIRNRDGKRVFYLGAGDRLTPGARDYLSSQRIEILPAEQARPQRYKLLGGGYLEEKPEHMTHLNGDVLVPKTHPRIAFRGKMDLLEAILLLCIQELSGEQKAEVQQILEYARYLLRCEVLDEPVTKDTLCGLTLQQQREQSHRPQDFYGQPHFMPEAADGRKILLLNLARCTARQAELCAQEAIADREGNPTRVDLLTAMNRLSSMLYILMIRCKADGR